MLHLQYIHQATPTPNPPPQCFPSRKVQEKATGIHTQKLMLSNNFVSSFVAWISENTEGSIKMWYKSLGQLRQY